MTKREKISSRWNSLLFNHLWLKYIVEYGFALIMTFLSAAFFAFGFCTLLDPAVSDIRALVSGGTSGLSQVIKLILELLHVPESFTNEFFSIAYFILNVPMMIIAFFGIGKRFGFFTFLNVLFVSLLTEFFKDANFVIELATAVQNDGGILARALFAGLCTGMSSAIAFKIESSAGGFDIIGYYLSLKKGTNTGPYLALINGSILTIYAILSGISHNGSWSSAISGLFFSIVYLFTVTLLIYIINIRNKKTQIEIITKDEKMPQRLMAYIPHGATLLKGKGAYSGEERFVVHMIVSTTEVRKVIKIIKQLDPESFVNVASLQQVHGNFHMKTVK